MSDSTTDINASANNPNNFLAPIIGSNPILNLLITVALVALIVYLIKISFYGNNVG